MPLWGKSLLHKNWMEESLGKLNRVQKTKIKAAFQAKWNIFVIFSQVSSSYLNPN